MSCNAFFICIDLTEGRVSKIQRLKCNKKIGRINGNLSKIDMAEDVG